MKSITETVFIADDGSRFKSAEACEAYEIENRKLADIFKGIPEWPKEDGTFIQGPLNLMINARRVLWAEVQNKYGETYKHWLQWRADDVHPLSMVGRILDDNPEDPLSRAWRRMATWDLENGRIYDQPYFVTHAGEAKEVKP